MGAHLGKKKKLFKTIFLAPPVSRFSDTQARAKGIYILKKEETQ